MESVVNELFDGVLAGTNKMNVKPVRNLHFN